MWRNFVLFLINNFLSKTRFFGIKRILLNSIKNVTIEKEVRIVGPIYFGNLTKFIVKSGTWIGRNFSIEGNGQVYIDNNVDIAPHVVILTGTHLVDDTERRAGKGKQLKVHINKGCWICARSTILGNTEIGEMSIVGACAFVNKDVPSNVLVTGNNGKITKTY